jgi:hypothetical protein
MNLKKNVRGATYLVVKNVLKPSWTIEFSGVNLTTLHGLFKIEKKTGPQKTKTIFEMMKKGVFIEKQW